MQSEFNPPAVLPLTLQEMPPKWAHLTLEVLNFINNQLGLNLQNRGLLLGVSGGVDSVSMLLMFKAVQQKLNLKLEVAHLDHGLRPSSRQEAEWVAALCCRLGLPCHLRRVDLGSGERALEEKGRQARYAFFRETREQSGLDYLALAHNLNDLAEDQLMRLLRGCGWPELGGMPGFDPRRGLLRPLLLQPRRKLEQMLAELGVGHMEDESNQSDKYTRNRVRRQIVPLLEQENQGYLKHAETLWKLAWADQAYWDGYLLSFKPDIRKAAESCGQSSHHVEVAIALDAAAARSEAVSLRLYRQCLLCLAEANGVAPFFTPAVQLFEINRAVKRRKTGQGSGVMCIQFPGGAEAVVAGREIIFRLNQKASS